MKGRRQVTAHNNDGERWNGYVLRRRSLKDEVFEYLHKRIVAGKYAPGEWLRQEDLANQLGVSQTPVREALDLLVSAGLARRVPYRGVHVIKLTSAEIVDAYIMRLLIEGVAVRVATNSISEDQIAELVDILEQTKNLVTLDDMSTQRQLNKRFHMLVVKATRNPLIHQIYEMVSNSFPDWMLYEYMFRHPELLEASLTREYREHKAILDAIAARDVERAVNKTIQHIRNLRKELNSFLGVPEEDLRKQEILFGLVEAA